MTITDHHAAADSFMKFMTDEYRLRGGCPADWVWINPPLTSSSTPVFHQEMLNYKLKPSYEYLGKPTKQNMDNILTMNNILKIKVKSDLTRSNKS